MSAAAISGVLLDVGGTLWPERWPPDDERNTRVAAALGLTSPAVVSELIHRLEAGAGAALTASRAGVEVPWDAGAMIATAAGEAGVVLDDAAVLAVRRAMALPAAGRIDLLPSARELLATIKALDLKCAVLSNTVWRDAQTYWKDFDDFGIARFIDAVVTSVDCGFRKPDRRVFEAALAAIDSPVGACIMVGNSEENDIVPALALGMRAIRVAIEQPRPPLSSAHAIARSLHEAAEILRSWVWSDSAAS